MKQILLIITIALTGCVTRSPSIKSHSNSSAKEIHQRYVAVMRSVKENSLSNREVNKLRDRIARMKFPCSEGAIKSLISKKISPRFAGAGDTFAKDGLQAIHLFSYELNSSYTLKVTEGHYVDRTQQPARWYTKIIGAKIEGTNDSR